MSLYDLPQSWETEETVALLMQLSTTQRRALRAYLVGLEEVDELLDRDPVQLHVHSFLKPIPANPTVTAPFLLFFGFLPL